MVIENENNFNQERINYFNRTNVVDRTKDTKSENEALCLAIRKLTLRKKLQDLVTIEARLLGIWSKIVGKQQSTWAEPTHSRRLARREQRTVPWEAIDQTADGKGPTEREKEIKNAQEKQKA